MIRFVKKDKRTELEKEIDRVLGIMKELDPTTEKYAHAANQVEKLRKARIYEKDNKVSKNTVWQVVGNVVVVVMVIGYERFNVITSKAGQYILKGRV
jgi:hypothetical protein